MGKALIGLLAGLLVTNVVAGQLQREELERVPEEWRGDWVDMEGLNEIAISEDGPERRWNEIVRYCNVEKVVRYYQSPFLFAGYLFGRPATAIIFDKASTQRQQQRVPINTPEDFRKTYYIQQSEQGWFITVDESTYMSRGWEGSEGVYVWPVEDFIRR